MVFLFPGIIFRRIFFSGELKNQFEEGNPLERFLWNILSSIFCIISFTLIVSYINYLSNGELSFDITYKDLKIFFVNLYENKFPSFLDTYTNLKTLVYIIISLYIYCMFLGIFSHYIYTILKLDNTLSFLNFNMSWDNLTKSTSKTNSNHKSVDIFITNLDIKMKNGELFTGEKHKIIYDKDGNPNYIALKNAYKFYRIEKNSESDTIENTKIQEIRKNTSNDDFIIHSENAYQFIYRKKITGNIFTIVGKETENINIVFIKIDNVFKRYLQIITRITYIILIILSGLISSYAIWDFEIFVFNTTIQRILFAVTTSYNLLLVSNMIKSVFIGKNNIYLDLTTLLIISTSYLYVFNLINFISWIFILLIIIIIIFIIPEKVNN